MTSIPSSPTAARSTGWREKHFQDRPSRTAWSKNCCALRPPFATSTPCAASRPSTVVRKRLAHESLNAALVALGVLSAAMGLKGFLLSSSFIDGGVTGISMLLRKTSGVSLSVLLPVINIPFIIVGYRQLGRAFAI